MTLDKLKKAECLRDEIHEIDDAKTINKIIKKAEAFLKE